MQYHHIGHQIKGFYYITKWAQRNLVMVSEKAQHKLNALQFWDKHGLAATLDAFKISRRTAFLWKAQLKAGHGRPLALEEQSKRPHQVRKRQWPKAVMDEIKRLQPIPIWVKRKSTFF